MTLVTIYIDSNVIVAAQLDDEKQHTESKEFMQRVLGIREPDTYYVTSVFTFLELASAMIRRTQSEDRALALLYKIRNSWKRSIRPVSPLPTKQLTSFTALVESLIDTTIRFHTRSADTIHAQSVYIYDFDYLVTWNARDFVHLKKTMRRLTILNPREMHVLLSDWAEARRKGVRDVKVRVKHRLSHTSSPQKLETPASNQTA